MKSEKIPKSEKWVIHPRNVIKAVNVVVFQTRPPSSKGKREETFNEIKFTFKGWFLGELCSLFDIVRKAHLEFLRLRLRII